MDFLKLIVFSTLILYPPRCKSFPHSIKTVPLRRSSNNLNQLTRRVHETGRIYDADLEDIAQRQEQLWEGVKEILTQLSRLS